VVVDLFSRDTCKTANVNHKHINNKNSKYKRKKLKSLHKRVRTTIRIYITQLKMQKCKGDITLHHTDNVLQSNITFLFLYF